MQCQCSQIGVLVQTKWEIAINEYRYICVYDITSRLMNFVLLDILNIVYVCE